MNYKKATGEKLRDFILGIQDGIVNVLGLVLGVAAATLETRVVLIAGLAGLVAESVSMGAVAYTSSKAARDYYKSAKEGKEASIYQNPFRIGLFVFWATVLGSIIPLIPFFLMSVKAGIIASVILCGITLFVVGAVKGKLTVGNWKRTGLEMLAVGMVAAAIGYAVGILLGKI